MLTPLDVNYDMRATLEYHVTELDQNNAADHCLRSWHAITLADFTM